MIVEMHYSKGCKQTLARYALILIVLLCAAGCTLDIAPPTPVPPSASPDRDVIYRQAPAGGDPAVVTRVIDGDTIDVRLNGEIVRVRYIGVNTPERDEPCFSSATEANRALVEGQPVVLTRDQSDTDRYGRLLRFVYVGDVFVNATLAARGFAESVEYRPDITQAPLFRQLEQQAAAAGLGCHPSGIFTDGSYTR